MKKINLLVTGTSLTSEDCSDKKKCNYDFSFLFDQPSMLIWSDKIILTNHCNDYIFRENPSYFGNKMGKALQTLFDIAKEYDMIEIKNPDLILTKDMVEKIDAEIEHDRINLYRKFPRKVRLGHNPTVPGELIVNKNHFCSVILYGVYGSLILAKEWKAESLFTEEIYDYCKLKFEMSIPKKKKGKENQTRTKAFNEIFNVILPEQDLFPYYAIDDIIGTRAKLNCSTCKKTSVCDKNFTKDLDNNVRDYLTLRERDEIQQIKGVLQDITHELESGNPEIDDVEIIQEFKKQERLLNRDLQLHFPKIRRWTYLGLVCSSPFALLGQATGLPMVTYAGASGLFVSGATKTWMDFTESKYKWVGFLQESRQKSKKNKS